MATNNFDFFINFRAITGGINSSINRISESMNNLNGITSRVNERFSNISSSLSNVANIAAFGTAFKGITSSYSELEDAETFLNSSFLESSMSAFELDKNLKNISDKATQLGNKLPGNSTDFYNMASTMKQLGLETDTIAEGGLEAAANMAVVLKMPFDEAASSTAKFIDQLGIAKTDSVAFVDTMQRIGHMGVDMRNMSLAFENTAGKLKAVGWQGLDSVNQMAPIIAMLSKLMGGGATAGTGISTVIGKLASSEDLKKINSDLAKYNINLDLIDKKGQFIKDPGKLVAELDKISHALKNNVISESNFISMAKTRFGEGAGADAFLLMVKNGIKGYNDFSDKIYKQASLQQRIELISSTFTNTIESLKGTFSNLLAIIGSSIVPTLTVWANKLNDIIAKTSSFLENNKKFASVIAWSISIFAGLTVVLSGVALAIPILTSSLGLIITPLSLIFTSIKTFTAYIPVFIATFKSMIPVIFTAIKHYFFAFFYSIFSLISKFIPWFILNFAAGLSKISTFFIVFKTTLISNFNKLIIFFRSTSLFSFIYSSLSLFSKFLSNLALGFRNIILYIPAILSKIPLLLGYIKALSIAFITNPFTWLILGIITTAFLIYRYWNPISGFFKGLFSGIKQSVSPALAPLISAFVNFGKSIFNVFNTLFPSIFPMLKKIYDYLMSFIRPFQVSGEGAKNFGEKLGKILGGIVAKIMNITSTIFNAGANIINSLTNGMKSVMNKPVETINNILTKLRRYLPFSPAKEGPLKDIHRIKLIETISQAIKPSSLLEKFKSTLDIVSNLSLPIIPINFKDSFYSIDNNIKSFREAFKFRQEYINPLQTTKNIETKNLNKNPSNQSKNNLIFNFYNTYNINNSEKSLAQKISYDIDKQVKNSLLKLENKTLRTSF